MCMTKHFTYYSTWMLRFDKAHIFNGLFSVFSRMNDGFVSSKPSVFHAFKKWKTIFLSVFFLNKLESPA